MAERRALPRPAQQPLRRNAQARLLQRMPAVLSDHELRLVRPGPALPVSVSYADQEYRVTEEDRRDHLLQLVPHPSPDRACEPVIDLPAHLIGGWHPGGSPSTAGEASKSASSCRRGIGSAPDPHAGQAPVPNRPERQPPAYPQVRRGLLHRQHRPALGRPCRHRDTCSSGTTPATPGWGAGPAAPRSGFRIRASRSRFSSRCSVLRSTCSAAEAAVSSRRGPRPPAAVVTAPRRRTAPLPCPPVSSRSRLGTPCASTVGNCGPRGCCDIACRTSCGGTFAGDHRKACRGHRQGSRHPGKGSDKGEGPRSSGSS